MTVKKIRQILKQVLIISLITLVLAEISMRVMDTFYPSFIFHKGEQDRFRGRPYSDDWDFKLNSRGYKDVEFGDKKPDTYRIIGIGDSFAFGIVPYRYNYLTLLEQQLQADFPHVELLNMGIVGTSPRDYLSLLIREGLDLQPDMLLLSVFVGNDFDETRSKKWYEYSYVASFFHYLIHIRRHFKGMLIHGKGKYCDHCASFDEPTYLTIERYRAHIFIRDDKPFEAAFQRVRDYLLAINKICEQRHIKLIIALIPDEIQFNTHLRNQVQQQFFAHITPQQWDFAQPNQKLAQFLQQQGISYLDLYPLFRQQYLQHQGDTNWRLYRLRDTHWNIAGNQFAADSLKPVVSHYIRPKSHAL